MARDRFDDDRYRDDDRYDDDRPRRRDDRDRDSRDRDRDDRPREIEPPSNGPATMSLLLGILSFVGGLTAIPGLVCGFAGLSKAKKLGGAGKGTAVTGTALSGVGLLVLAGTIWLVIWWFGRVSEDRARIAAENNLKQVGLATTNNLKQIGLAMHNYEGSYGRLPSGAGGRTQPGMRESELKSKLSWRVDLLPYIEQENIYRQMRLDEPWDGFANKQFASIAIRTYSDPDTESDPDTRYRVFYGRNTAFEPQLGFGVSITRITDGTSNTIMAAESGEKVTWSRFGEIRFDESNPPDPKTFGRPTSDTFQVVLFDGSVRNIRKTMSRETFKNAIMPFDGNVLGSDW